MKTFDFLFDGVSTGEIRDVKVDSTQTVDGNHGRIEARSAYTLHSAPHKC